MDRPVSYIASPRSSTHRSPTIPARADHHKTVTHHSPPIPARAGHHKTVTHHSPPIPARAGEIHEPRKAATAPLTHHSLQTHATKHGSVPVQFRMNSPHSYDILSNFPKVTMKQTRLGWLQELVGCTANTEFHLKSGPDSHMMYAVEQSSAFMRFLLPNTHSWDLTLWHGRSAIAPSVNALKYHRPLRMPLFPLKCCCHQSVSHHDSQGKLLGGRGPSQYTQMFFQLWVSLKNHDMIQTSKLEPITNSLLFA
jgi:hypothetical protein